MSAHTITDSQLIQLTANIDVLIAFCIDFVFRKWKKLYNYIQIGFDDCYVIRKILVKRNLFHSMRIIMKCEAIIRVNIIYKKVIIQIVK